MNQINTEKKKTPILDFSEQEFQTFLYSERDRENSLSQYQGWNNWALIGAMITVLSVAYASLKAGSSLIGCVSHTRRLIENGEGDSVVNQKRLSYLVGPALVKIV